MKERTLINKQYIAYLISKSVTHDLDTLLNATSINCYAAARMLTYPDAHRQYYSPGRLYNLYNGGSGRFLTREISDLEFVHQCIMLDSMALNQPCTRVTFEQIAENDGYHYFGFCKSQIVLPRQVNLKQSDDWHFIFRLPTGLWLHKPGFDQSIDVIDWIEEGKFFASTAYSDLVSFSLPVKVTCFRNMFYRLDNQYELSLPKNDFKSFVENF